MGQWYTMSTDPNTRRLHDKIEMLERINETQRAQVELYRGRNASLEREVQAARKLIGRMGEQAAQAQERW